ncbi:MAG: cytochrome b/b6 domain-containing protein [Actinomycetota bacterium]|nr:cytochrome b/b6 domain-containing protein [Actinomycetota bacterium]
MRKRPPGAAGSLLRFDGVSRLVHWATAALVLTLVATGLILYVPALSLAVGDRLAVEDLHIACGLACGLPLALGVSGPWGRRLRRDLASMNRMSAAERSWLRRPGHGGSAGLAKFNPGQKLNATAVAGLLVVLLATGILLRWGTGLAISWRTGATFVHDWFALAISVLIVGHVLFALVHPGALRSMVTGRVSRSWQLRHAPGWQPLPDEALAGEPAPVVRALGEKRRARAR